MNIIILGSEGFIGQHLTRFYKELKWNVTGCDQLETGNQDYDYHKLSLLSSGLNKIFSEGSFDICINAAGSASVGYSISNPLHDFEANTYLVFHVLESIRKHNPSCTFLQISSAAVYGNPEKLPVNESATLKPLSPYGWHKLMSEMACEEYTRLYNIKTVIIRPFSAYGPGLKKQLLWEIYQKYLSGKKSVELWGKGDETRDFIYITDLVHAIDIILQNGKHAADIYNVASGCETSIRDITTMFISQFDPQTGLIFNQQIREGDPINWKADINKLKELGFTPTVSPDKGVQHFADWLKTLN